MNAVVAGWSVMGALALAVACRSGEARRLESEIAALGQRIDALREAPNEAKRPLLSALENAACEQSEACALKKTCVSAYRLHLAALAAKDRVRALLAAPDGGAEATLAAASGLAQAERDLELSRAETSRCASLQGQLRRASRPR